MITIGKPYIYEDAEYAYLKAPIHITEDTSKAYMALQGTFKRVHWRLYENYPPVEWQSDDSGLWFAVPKAYKQYLCAERGDAFVVAMIWYAMVTESDIVCETPISHRMLFGIRYQLIPALMKTEKGYHRHINIQAPTTTEAYPNEHAVGTGMSCGVDSMYSLHLYHDDSVPEGYKLTHLTYFNMGAIFHPDRATKKVYTMKEFYETTDRMSDEKRANAQAVADMTGLPLLYVKSNLDSDYYRGAYGDTGVYRNCACVLALSGLFGKYYCSSRGRAEGFDLDLDKASEHYESLLCYTLSTEGLEFLLSDYDSRLDKTIAIADHAYAQQYLDVCFRFNNCGTCSKCQRTLVILDIVGKVDVFGAVFDIEKYKKDRIKAFQWLLITKDKDALDDDAMHARLIYDYAVSHQYPIPKEAYEGYEKYKKEKIAAQRKSALKSKVKHLFWKK